MASTEEIESSRQTAMFEGIDSREKERRWEKFREDRKAKSIQISKAKAAKKRRLTDAERAAHSKIPLELLAREWLNEQNASSDTRCYMVEKLLPTLVIGLEKLLNEVSLRGLEEYRLPQADFNPVNFVAQYLMRNNPRYSNFAEAHPYCRTMREVSEELKKMAYAIDENKLAELKAKTRQRREERDRDEAAKMAEKKRRHGLIRDAYLQWMIKSEDGISIGEVKMAVKSWLDMVSEHTLAPTLPDFFSPLLTMEEGLMREDDFMADMTSMTCELPTDLFDGLTRHLSVCGVERRNCKLKELRRELFSNVFSACDPDKTGMVDRQRVLHLLSLFYNSNPSGTQEKLRNPKQWPIVELIEAEELGGDDEDETFSSTTTTLLSEKEYQDFLTEGNAASEEETADKTDTGEQKKEKVVEETSDGGKSETDDEKELTKPADKEETPSEQKESLNPENEKDGEDLKKEGEGQTEQPSDGQAQATADGDKAEDTGTKAEEKPLGDEAGTRSDKSREGGRPSTRSVLVRRLTSYGSDRALSVTRQRRLSGISSVLPPPSSAGLGHSWDHVMLNCPQFVQLVEMFLGPDAEDAIVDAVSSYMRNNYTETAQERADRQELAKQQALQRSRLSRVSLLFEVWDNDRSGYLELEELQLVLSKWQGFSSHQALEHAEEVLSSLGAAHKRLTRTQFRIYIDQLTENMLPSEFDEFAEYLMASVALSFEEQRRGEQRREMLAQIQLAGKTSGLKFQQALKTAVAVIHKDNESFGGSKHITVGMAVLEPSNKSPDVTVLHFKAASPAIESVLVGKKLNQRFKRGVSFQAVDANRPLHVANIQKHGGVHFFIHDHRKEEYQGSLIVSPISTPRQQVVGTINVDSLSTYGEDSTTHYEFGTHEINFYQGVGVCLGEVFHWINARQKLLQVAESALTWIHRRCPLISQVSVYIVEPETTSQDHFTLRCMLTTLAKEGSKRSNKLLRKGENLFRDYLFQCSANSETVSADVYGVHHLAYPIRDQAGCAVAVVDFYMPPAQSLNRSQMRELTRVLKLLTLSFYQLSVLPEERLSEDEDDHLVGSTQSLLAGERSDLDAAVLFDQLLLADLQNTMSKLDNRVFAEMRSYNDPPELVLKIIQALLYILHPDSGEFETWKQCKQGITLALVKAMQSYDPLMQTSHPKLGYIKQLMETVSSESIKAQGSRPAKLIYSWISICVSILERSLSVTAQSPVTASPGVPQSAESAAIPQSALSTVRNALPCTPGAELSPAPAETRETLALGDEKQDSQ